MFRPLLRLLILVDVGLKPIFGVGLAREMESIGGLDRVARFTLQADNRNHVCDGGDAFVIVLENEVFLVPLLQPVETAA